jgi:phospholipid transport system substrate-binding protein
MKDRSRLVYRLFAMLVGLALGFNAAFSAAADSLQPISRDDPETMLEQATSQLLAISSAAREYADTDRERYYREVSSVLDQVMDIRYFARGVMATYASSRLYNSLKTDQEKAAFRARVEKFADALKRVWMVKYADALLRADGETIDIKRQATGSDNPDRASIEQTVHDREGNTYLIQYSLHKVKDGGWLITNVIVEGVNLGETYRSQFAEAVEKHGGDVDYVVDHWVELMLHNDEPAATAPAAG